jgi:hypothetical protein
MINTIAEGDEKPFPSTPFSPYRDNNILGPEIVVCG